MYQNSMNETARRVLISYKRCLEKAEIPEDRMLQILRVPFE